MLKVMSSYEKYWHWYDGAKLFDQIVELKTVQNKLRDKWNDMEICHEKWIDFFKNCESSEQYFELLRLCQYMFANLAHNVNVKRIFSNIQWTDERNRIKMETIEAIFQV